MNPLKSLPDTDRAARGSAISEVRFAKPGSSRRPAGVPARIAHCLVVATLALTSLSALAHTGADSGLHHGLLAGLAHPFTGIDHLVAALAVGWIASRVDRALAWRTPAAFLLAMLAGALAGGAGLSIPGIEPLLAVSVMLAGLAIASDRGAGRFALASVAAVFGFLHGIAHGLELANGPSAIGAVAASAALLFAGMRVGVLARNRNAAAVRAAGILTAGLGLGLLAMLART